jgi:N-alpha-acetyltransferase 15/16, NatA auxiliary subunit
MRDIPGFVETRHRMLQLRPSNRNNWIALAVAHHLDGNHELAVQILAQYESTLVRLQTPPRDSVFPSSRVRACTCPALAEAGAIDSTCHAVDDTCHDETFTAQDEVPANEAYEHSELLAYKAQVLAEGGQHAAALELLDQQQARHGIAQRGRMNGGMVASG